MKRPGLAHTESGDTGSDREPRSLPNRTSSRRTHTPMVRCHAPHVSSPRMESTCKTSPAIRMVGRILTTAILALVALLAVQSPPAEAHTPNPAACRIIWEAAPPGHRWEAKQRCLAAQRRHLLMHVCSKPRPLVPRTVRVKGKRVDSNQRHVLTTALNMGRNRDASYKVLLATVATTTQEASARELPYGDGTSVGPFQLIDDHGPEHLRITVEFSADWFLDGAINIDHHEPWHSVASLSQARQSSAHPDAYAKWVPEARRTVRAFFGPCRR